MVILKKDETGIFVALDHVDGRYLLKHFITMFFAKKFFDRMRRKYSKEEKE